MYEAFYLGTSIFTGPGDLAEKVATFKPLECISTPPYHIKQYCNINYLIRRVIVDVYIVYTYK